MSRRINVDKFRNKLDNNGVLETTLEWEVENKVWVLNIISLMLPVQHSMLCRNLIGSTSTHQSHLMGRP